MTLTKKQLLSYIDHSLLKPNLTKEQIIEGLNFAKDNECASVCINPCNLDLAYQILNGTTVKIGTVIGFPSGAHTTFSKVAETIDAYARGAVEMDMVIDIGALKNGEIDDVREDISAIVKASPAIVKVIFENYYLTEDEIKLACKITEEAGAHYVKTSTGFVPGGATVSDIKLMRNSVSPHIKVKAAGGVSTLSDCMAMIEAGSDRIGTSKTQQILEELAKMG